MSTSLACRRSARPAAALAVAVTVAVWGCDSGTAAGRSGSPVDGGRPDAATAPPPCSLDAECAAARRGEVCVDGACVPDPLDAPACGPTVACGRPMICGPDRVCGCREDGHCPPGFACGMGGACEHATGYVACVADAECGPGGLCLASACASPGSCGRRAALPAGPVRLVHHLAVREVVPEGLDAVLDALAKPFRVLAGDGLELDLGLPSFLERLAAQLAAAWAERHLEPWHRALLGLLADVDDLLAGFCLEERVVLEAPEAAWPAAAAAESVDVRLVFEHEETRLEGRPEALLGAPLALDPPRVTVGCDQLAVHPRTLELPVGALVVWLVDALVEEASDGRHRTVDAALAELSAGFCDGLSKEIGDEVGLGVGPVLRTACKAELDRLRARALAAARMATLGVDPVDLRAAAKIDAATGAIRDGRTEARLGSTTVGGAFELRAGR